MDGLIAPCPKELRPFQPKFRHLLIEELETKVDLGAVERNAAGSVFAAQQIDTPARLFAVLDAIQRWLPRSDYEALRRDILTLVRFALPDELREDDDKLHLEEFAMTPKERFTQKLEQYGNRLSKRAESKGRSEGRIEGQRLVLLKQLRLKFGPLPAGAESRLAQAGADRLETWTERVLLASSLDEVLE